MNRVQKIIAHNLIWFRKQKGLSQIDISEQTGLNYRYYQDIEAGKRNITVNTLQKVATVLDVPTEELASLNRISIPCPLEEFIFRKKDKLDSFTFVKIAIRDHNRKLKYVNQHFLETFEYSLEDVVEQPIDILFKNNDPQVMESTSRAHENGVSLNKIIVNINTKVSKQLISVVVLPVLIFFKGKVVGVFGGFKRFEEYNPNVFTRLQSEIVEHLMD